jgi:hypothetical protein
MRTSCKKPLGGAIGQKAQPATIDRPCQTAEAVTVNKGARAQVRASTLLQAGWDSLGCLSVIGRTSRLPCCPRSRIASLARYAREAHPEGPIGLRRREGPPIAGLEVLFASREYAPPPVPFPARKRATIVSTRFHPGLDKLCAGADRPAHGSPLIPDSPAGFLESGRGYRMSGRQRGKDHALTSPVRRVEFD